ncbi:MAG: NEW3 domain-containing protein [Chloroflexota bacterium]
MSRILRLISIATLVFVIAGATLVPATVLAQDEEAVEAEEEEEESEETLSINAAFPSMEGPSDTTFKFKVEFTYRTTANQGKDFDLTVSGPSDWLTYVAESEYKLDNRISAVHLEPYSVKQPVIVVAIAPFWLYPEPGDYPIDLQVAGEGVEESIELTATITSRYGIDAETETGRLNTKTTAGNTSTVNVVVTNSGTDTLDNVGFSADKPSGIGNEQWKVEFDPRKIENLEPGDDATVEVAVTPPSKTIAGDYMITLNFDGDPALSSEPPSLDIRVAVGTRTSWGIIGAVIIALVVGGLVYAFKEFGRR